MAKITVAVLTLIMLAVWGWMAWEGHKHKEDAEFLQDEDIEYSLVKAAHYTFGTGPEKIPGQFREAPEDVTQEQNNIRIALGAIVALSATLFFAVTGGSGAIFGVMITAFVSFLAAACNMILGIVFTAMVALTTIEMLEMEVWPLNLSIAVYAVLLYSGVVILASFAAMRQMNGLVRGRRDPMKGVMKSLLVLMLASGGLGPFGVVPQFSIAGFSGFYALAALCLLALLFIGLTHSNYGYD